MPAWLPDLTSRNGGRIGLGLVLLSAAACSGLAPTASPAASGGASVASLSGGIGSSRPSPPTLNPTSVALDTSLPARATPATPGTAEPSAAPASARPVFLVPDSVDATGATDAAPALQAFVNSVPDGSTIVFPVAGLYRLTAGIALDDRHDLVFVGRGSTLESTGCDVATSLFLLGWASPSSSITIQDLNLKGDDVAAGTPDAFREDCQSQMGVAIYQSSDVSIANVHISQVHGDCVYIDVGGVQPVWSSGITFRDSACALNGRQGVAVVAGRDVTVQRVDFDGIGLFPFDIEPNDARGGAENVRFIDNTVGTYTHSSQFSPYLFEANGSDEAPVDHVAVRGTIVTGGSLRSKVQRSNRRDISFTDNIAFVADAGPVLLFDHVEGLTVVGNVQPLLSGPLATYGDSTNVVSQANNVAERQHLLAGHEAGSGT